MAQVREVPEVTVRPATVEQLVALRDDRAAFAKLLGCPAPDGWPEFGEAIGFTIDTLTAHPDQAQWWMHFFLAEGGTLLVGSGGFVGPPRDGVVEIGYEIAPGFRGRGYATAAARAMIDKAVGAGAAVTTVIAHTRAHENPSTGVLRRLGFRRIAEIEDPDDGPVWRWRCAVAATQFPG
ncbi:GNAT family N-acetyltransferase [Mycolicibacterium sp. S2-37]|uniref:GNAT family N-acetyltransferase n=1 Tax=Mycolicibacterium sp. S2-37 TaxID=2810297 RepID=UPI001A9485BF|nr:GNAT family protein [Mycolicibacterium sp. S2-37]MBO0678531.1 GNAT family N-acetyltransferase [Mycolicibacterium sp. S2-37]